MEDLTVFEIVGKLMGAIVPVGETNHDNKCLFNLDDWEDLHYKITQKLLESAKGEAGRDLASVKAVSDKARDKIYWMYKYLGQQIQEWENFSE